MQTAIENGDAAAQVEANKRIATLAFENAKLEQRKTSQPVAQETPVQLSDGGRLPQQTPRNLPQADPMAESWAGKNTWFGTDRAMTFTAFEIHKDLVDKEGLILNLMNTIKKLINGLELTLVINLVILRLSKRTGPFSR